MSTLVEIQDAVTRLPVGERKALQLWLNSLTEPELTVEEERRLLRSLDEALRDIDAGKGVPLDDVRKRVASWASPDWHGDVLRDREAKIKSGEETFMDWETAKKQLRKKLM